MPKKTTYQNAVRREMEQRGAAQNAASEGIRGIHNDLADRHAAVASGEREKMREEEEPS